MSHPNDPIGESYSPLEEFFKEEINRSIKEIMKPNEVGDIPKLKSEIDKLQRQIDALREGLNNVYSTLSERINNLENIEYMGYKAPNIDSNIFYENVNNLLSVVKKHIEKYRR